MAGTPRVDDARAVGEASRCPARLRRVRLERRFHLAVAVPRHTTVRLATEHSSYAPSAIVAFARYPRVRLERVPAR